MSNKNLYTLIPKVDEILEKAEIKKILKIMPRKIVLDSIRGEIDELRKAIGKLSLNEEQIIERNNTLGQIIVKRATKKNSNKLKRVVNATGTVIHTNIGRSLIHEDIMENVKEIACNYSNLEYDLEKGERGSRYSHLEEIITEITGGEAAMVVNNNAAAVMLVLSTMAKGSEVIVSRGELVEIGGSFRIPDVMEQSGAELVSVGTTNKTHVEDFENAITEETKALLKVHTSNYRILGFTSTVTAEELKPLKSKYNIPLIEDLGSGVLIDLAQYGLEHEPTVQESIRNGVDVVTFSGDKLLGGPQAGIIVGKKEYIEAMKKNPLTRAFRVDKFTISALEATFKVYLDEDIIIGKIPTLNMLSLRLGDIEEKAEKLYYLLESNIDNKDLHIEIVDNYSEVGGGSLPLERIPTKCLMLSFENIKVSEFERNLREYDIPIITRVYKGNLYMDLRTIKEDEYNIVLDAIKYSLKQIKGVV